MSPPLFVPPLHHPPTHKGRIDLDSWLREEIVAEDERLLWWGGKELARAAEYLAPSPFSAGGLHKI